MARDQPWEWDWGSGSCAAWLFLVLGVASTCHLLGGVFFVPDAAGDSCAQYDYRTCLDPPKTCFTDGKVGKCAWAVLTAECYCYAPHTPADRFGLSLACVLWMIAAAALGGRAPGVLFRVLSVGGIVFASSVTAADESHWGTPARLLDWQVLGWVGGASAAIFLLAPRLLPPRSRPLLSPLGVFCPTAGAALYGVGLWFANAQAVQGEEHLLGIAARSALALLYGVILSLSLFVFLPARAREEAPGNAPALRGLVSRPRLLFWLLWAAVLLAGLQVAVNLPRWTGLYAPAVPRIAGTLGSLLLCGLLLARTGAGGSAGLSLGALGLTVLLNVLAIWTSTFAGYRGTETALRAYSDSIEAVWLSLWAVPPVVAFLVDRKAAQGRSA